MIYLELFISFFLIGLFTFGGGYAMIPLINDLVLSKCWLTDAEFIDLIGVCESTPGPIAINMATYIGSIKGGILGSVFATFGVVLPSFIIILLIASISVKLINNVVVKSFLKGVKPVVIALIIFTGISLLLSLIVSSYSQITLNIKPLICLFIIVVIYYLWKLIFKKKVSTILLLCISALIGIVVGIL